MTQGWTPVDRMVHGLPGLGSLWYPEGRWGLGFRVWNGHVSPVRHGREIEQNQLFPVWNVSKVLFLSQNQSKPFATHLITRKSKPNHQTKWSQPIPPHLTFSFSLTEAVDQLFRAGGANLRRHLEATEARIFSREKPDGFMGEKNN